jgi:hypothetical protein
LIKHLFADSAYDRGKPLDKAASTLTSKSSGDAVSSNAPLDG